MLAWLVRNPFLGVALAGVLLLGGLAARDFSRSQGPAPIVFHAANLLDGEPIRVHVAGAVQAPGVYAMHGGDRVEDAIALAGGATEGATLDGINLARRLRDGEQVLVPGAPARASSSVALVEGEFLDLNLATREQLIALPGIGEAYSRRIVDSRTADGPFQSLEDLLVRRLIPASTLETIRPFVTIIAPEQ